MNRFRPLSGSYISQSGMKKIYIAEQSFRPLSGSYISQFKRLSEAIEAVPFPSPIGELYFSIRISVSVHSFPSGFRPLSGSYISQYKAKF